MSGTVVDDGHRHGFQPIEDDPARDAWDLAPISAADSADVLSDGKLGGATMSNASKPGVARAADAM